MATKNYQQRFENLVQAMKNRKVQIERRVGKKLMFSEMEIINAIRNRKVPTQMQHCILKVFNKVGGETDRERFISAFNICGANFGRNGYQKYGFLTLTGKGVENNLRHRKEINNASKEARYKQLESMFNEDINTLIKKENNPEKNTEKEDLKNKKEVDKKEQDKKEKPKPDNMIVAKDSTRK